MGSGGPDIHQDGAASRSLAGWYVLDHVCKVLYAIGCDSCFIAYHVQHPYLLFEAVVQKCNQQRVHTCKGCGNNGHKISR